MAKATDTVKTVANNPVSPILAKLRAMKPSLIKRVGEAAAKGEEDKGAMTGLSGLSSDITTLERVEKRFNEGVYA